MVRLTTQRTSVLLLAATSTFQVHGALVPKLRARNHFGWARRAIGSAQGLEGIGWTPKQDSTLLFPDPPVEVITQAQEQNTQLARNAYLNLAKISGGSAAAPSSSQSQDGDSGSSPSSTLLSDGTDSPAGQGDNDGKLGLESILTKRAGHHQKPPPGPPSVDPAEGGAPSHPPTPGKVMAAAMQHRMEAVPRSLAGRAPAAPVGKFQYGKDKVRGVNIGGWLVLEPWITPTLFADTDDNTVVDEYTYGAKYGPIEASRLLTAHWDSWITEADFAAIASYGLNHVRIPIGYWALDTSRGEPYPQGQYPYLFKAVGWAKKHGLRVMIDIHGAPGSQNGFDNSGRRGTADWPNDDQNVKRTKDVLQTLIDDFYVPEYRDTVTAIELLNEPAGFLGGKMMEVVKQYYYDGYGQVRYPASPDGDTNASSLLVTIHDAFQPLPSWKGFMPAPSWVDAALDTHYYTVFNEDDLRMTPEQRLQAVCKAKAGLVESDKNLWTMVGEWSPAATDCALSLNGRGIGARYDGTYPGSTRIGSCDGKTGDASTFTPEYKAFLGQYWEAQVGAFEAASGWLQWAWKTEKAHEWSYQKGVEYGWIPRDPTQRRYSDPCSS